MRIKTLTAASVLALTSTFAFAQTNVNPNANINANTANPGMSMVQVLQQLEKSGYTNIDDIDREGSGYEVTATNPNGQLVEITIDGNTGEVVNSEPED